MAIQPQHISLIKNKYLLEHIKQEAQKTHTDENYAFYYDKGGNQQLYDKYIKDGSSMYVNLPNKLSAPLHKLAKEKKWSSMSAGLKAARAEIGRVLDDNTLANFAKTEEGQRALAVVNMGLDGSKAIQAQNLTLVYEKPVRPQAKWEAYEALQKLASKSKVDAALTALGKPPPAKPPTDEELVARFTEIDRQAKQLLADIAVAQKYFDSALKYIAKQGVPRDHEEVTRMFESGRMRHEKIHRPWEVLIRKDRQFAAKYKKVAAAKKKIDDDYGKFRTKLDGR